MNALGETVKLGLQIGGHRSHQFVQAPPPLGSREVLDPDLQRILDRIYLGQNVLGDRDAIGLQGPPQRQPFVIEVISTIETLVAYRVDATCEACLPGVILVARRINCHGVLRCLATIVSANGTA
jgi:hypothetical protein